jgi:putative DNA methylase
VADTLSKAKNTTVSGLEQAGLLQARAGRVTLRSVHDIDGERRLAGNERVSEWEICLHLTKRLHDNGDVAAAELMAAVRDKADLSAVKELSYLLFSIADRKGWADAAVLFNGLGTSWSDLERAARKPGYAGSTYVQDPAIPDE